MIPTGNQKYAPQTKYKAAKCKGMYFQFVLSTDADILEHLAKQPNRQGYVKALIRADIAKSKEK